MIEAVPSRETKINDSLRHVLKKSSKKLQDLGALGKILPLSNLAMLRSVALSVQLV